MYPSLFPLPSCSSAGRTAPEYASAGAHAFIAELTQRDIDRFWAKVDTSGECWNWTSTIQRLGYGQFRVGTKQLKAHRVAWVIFNGPIPTGKLVCHHCDNRKCVRPDHLFIGTARDNTHDCIQKGRFPAGRKGEDHHYAKLTEPKVKEIRDLCADSDGPTLSEVAEMYGVHLETIRRIQAKKTWRHVD